MLPSSFRWSSSNILISPKPDATHTIAGIKDPSVVFANGRWHVFASVANASGYNLVYLNFTDWSQAASATRHYLDPSPIGSSYRAAPEVFYFAPQNLWYLVYQTGNASYSTNPDIGNPNGWSAPRNFYPSMPAIFAQNDAGLQPQQPLRGQQRLQGPALDPGAGGDYNSLPWRLGLLTQTNSTC